MPVSPEKLDQIHQQTQTEERASYSGIEWSTVALGLSLALLFWLFGPVLFLALLIRKWAAIPLWDAKERWTSIKGAAFLSLLCYLPVILFHLQLTSLWSSFPVLGGSSIFPPMFDNMLFRWVIALPLVNLLAWMIEVVSPKTIWHPRRVLLPSERVLVESTLPKGSNKTPRKTREQQTPRNGSARKGTVDASMQPSEVLTGSSQGVRATAKSQSTTKRESKPRKKRDSRTIWERMPVDHPWKQEAKREAMRQAGSQQTNEPEFAPNPSSQQADYNWNEGEGVLKI